MCNTDHSSPRCHFQDKVRRPPAHILIQPFKWLIQEQDLAVRVQRPEYGSPLTHSSGIFTYRLILLSAEAQIIQPLLHFRLRTARTYETDVGHCCQSAAEPVLLEHGADPVRHAFHAALIWLFQSHKDPQKRCLPAAGRPHDTGCLSSRDIRRKCIQHFLGSVGFGQISDTDVARSRSRCLFCRIFSCLFRCRPCFFPCSPTVRLSAASVIFLRSAHLLHVFHPAVNEPEKYFFKEHADHYDYQSPGKQIRRVQIDLGIIEIFPYGVFRQSDYFSRDAGFPAQAQRQRASGAEKRQDLGHINITDPEGRRNPEHPRHLRQITVQAADPVLYICINYREYHQEGNNHRQILRRYPDQHQDNEGSHRDRLYRLYKGLKEFIHSAESGGEPCRGHT